MRGAIVFLLSFLLSVGLMAQQYTLSSFEMTISGTSTLHDWTSVVNDVQAEAVLVWNENRLERIPSLEVKARSESIISGKGSIMDNKTWTALKKDAFPHIVFELKKATISAELPYNISAFGNLSIAGVTRAVQLRVQGEPVEHGRIRFTGQYDLLMTDFGIDPPTALMGSLQTGDAITVNFEVVFAKGGQSLGLK
jgi:polyisoprenoid-binding protein YceI